jgi:hypothetical protein
MAAIGEYHVTIPHIDDAASFPKPRLWYAQMLRKGHGFGVKSTAFKRQAKRKKFKICLIGNEVEKEQ